jgi:hypothetical protein
MILYSLDSIFRKESETAIKTDMRALVLNLLKIEIYNKSSQKRSKRLQMSQESIICAQNLNLGPRAQTAKNRKFLHVARKNAIEPRIMQGTSLYAHNCSKLSRDPLQPCLLKVATPVVCRHLSQMHGNQVNSNSEPNNHVPIIYLSLMRTNLLLNKR